MKYFIVIICSAIVLLSACYHGRKVGKTTSGYYQYEVECEGTELDGSQMVRGFGNGKNYDDAKNQAKKNALYGVIFKGVRLGKTGCSVKPLLFDPNAYDQNSDYFNEFFKDGGNYSNFVTIRDTPRRSKLKENSGDGSEKLFGIIVTIDIVALKKELMEKGIIKKTIE